MCKFRNEISILSTADATDLCQSVSRPHRTASADTVLLTSTSFGCLDKVKYGKSCLRHSCIVRQLCPWLQLAQCPAFVSCVKRRRTVNRNTI